MPETLDTRDNLRFYTAGYAHFPGRRGTGPVQNRPDPSHLAECWHSPDPTPPGQRPRCPAVAQDLWPAARPVIRRILLETVGRLLRWHLIGLRLAVGAAGPRRGKGQTWRPPNSGSDPSSHPLAHHPKSRSPELLLKLCEPVASGAMILPLI